MGDVSTLDRGLTSGKVNTGGPGRAGEAHGSEGGGGRKNAIFVELNQGLHFSESLQSSPQAVLVI